MCLLMHARLQPAYSEHCSATNMDLAYMIITSQHNESLAVIACWSCRFLTIRQIAISILAGSTLSTDCRPTSSKRLVSIHINLVFRKPDNAEREFMPTPFKVTKLSNHMPTETGHQSSFIIETTMSRIMCAIFLCRCGLLRSGLIRVCSAHKTNGNFVGQSV